jgi:hypothetical protein
MFDRYQIVSPGDLRDAASGVTALAVMKISMLEPPATVSAVFRSTSRT